MDRSTDEVSNFNEHIYQILLKNLGMDMSKHTQIQKMFQF